MTKKNYQIVRDQNGFRDLIKYVEARAFISFDIETNSAEEIDARVIGIGVTGRPNEGWYLCLSEYSFEQQKLVDLFTPAQELGMVKELCQLLLKKKLLMHNGVYDITTMWHRYEIDLSPALLCDTILLKHTVDEERPFGLKDLALLYAADIGFSSDELANQEQLELKEEVIARGGKWNKKDKEIYKATALTIGKYCCADVDLTLKIFDFLEQEQLIPQGLEEFFYEQEVMPLYINATIPMKMKGVYVDVPYFKKLKTETEDGIIKLTDEVFELLSDVIEPKVREILDKAVQVTKTGTFATKALHYFNIDPPISGKTGKPTLAKSTLQSLETLYPSHPVIEFLLRDTPLPEKDVYAIKKEIFVDRNPDLPNVFNLSSTKHLSWLLFKALGCEPKSFSRKTGDPKVDKNSLEEYDEIPFIKPLAKLKKEEKLLNTYIIPILEKHRDGWLYPSMLQFGTTSGRYSCSGGLNLQTLPRDDKRIKKGFIAPPGYKVVNADFSSLEPRIFSWVSGDDGLKKVWLQNLDLYSEIAINVFKLKGFSSREEDENFLKKKAPDLRQKSKIFTLAVPYGANAYRIAELMKVEVKEAQEIVDDYLNSYPELKEYMATQEDMARNHGYVKTQFGRVRHLHRARELYDEYGELILSKIQMAIEFAGPEGSRLYSVYKKVSKKRDQESKDYAKEIREEIMKKGFRGVELYYIYRNLMNNAKNFPIQATAAHVANSSLIKLARSFKKSKIDGWIALQIHDEITCIVKEHDAERAAKLLKDAMENNEVTRQIDIPMIADPLIADNFAEAK